MAARLRARTSPRRRNSPMAASRCRCSTTPITAPMTSTMITTVPNRSRARSERIPRVMASVVPIQPDLAERDVRIAQAIDLDAADVALEHPLVGMLVEGDQRSVLDDLLIGF